MKHADLGASSANRWIACPGCINETKRMPLVLRAEAGKSSPYAAEGSAAHALAETVIRNRIDVMGQVGRVVTLEGAILPPGEPVVEEKIRQLTAFTITEEMAEGVMLYERTLHDQMAKLSSPQLFLEQTVYPLPGEPEVFGTGDAIIHEPYGKLHVNDFKFGKGIVVEPDWNDQVMFYGLGALERVNDDAAVSEVEIGIIQPRANHAKGPVRMWTTTPAVLREFQDMLRGAVAATRQPDAPLVTGDHCRWCPALGTCRAVKKERHELAITEFSEALGREVPTITDQDDLEQLRRNLEKLPIIEAWCKEQSILGLRAALRGANMPGWKAVYAGKNRQWKSESGLLAALTAEDISQDASHTPGKLKSPAQLERVMGKEWVDEHAHKPQGAPTLVRASDPRDPVPPATSDYDGIDL